MVFVRAFGIGAALGLAAVVGWAFGDALAGSVTSAVIRRIGAS